MCKACWEDAGAPQIYNQDVHLAVAAIDAVYDFSDVGGNLHSMIDDNNLEDDYFGWSNVKENIEAESLQRACEFALDPNWKEAELICYELLAALPEPERYSALALYDGFWLPS